MDKFRGTTTLFLFWFIILSPQILSTVGDGGQHDVENKPEKASVIEIITATFSLLTRSPISSWDKVKSFINQLQIQYFPPNLDFRSADEAHSGGGGGSGNGAGERMKDAVEKSFGTSKVTVEESAKSAAKFVGEAMQKTAEKVKDSVSNRDESDAEL